jgi:hypothetical protein
MPTKKAKFKGNEVTVVFGNYPELSIYTLSHQINNEIKVTGISKEIEEGDCIDLDEQRWRIGRDLNKRYLLVKSVKHLDSTNTCFSIEERKNMRFEAICQFIPYTELIF